MKTDTVSFNNKTQYALSYVVKFKLLPQSLNLKHKSVGYIVKRTATEMTSKSKHISFCSVMIVCVCAYVRALVVCVECCVCVCKYARVCL